MVADLKRKRVGWYFIAPVAVLLSIFLLYPIIYSLYLTLTSTRGTLTSFTGLTNYRKLFSDPLFFKALGNTFRILVLQVPIMLILALIFASMLNNKKVKFKGFFRTAIFLPSVTSLIAYAILFKMLFSYDGMVNDMLISIGLLKTPIAWMQSALSANFVLILAMVWRWTGYNMIFYLSAMQNINSDLYEAASIDGASETQSFFRITLPLLKPMILFTTVMSTIGTLQLFDEPMNFSAGGTTASMIGPDNCFLTLSVYIYNLCFKSTPKFGYSATVSYAVLIIVVILTIIQFRISKEDDVKFQQKMAKRRNRRNIKW